MICHLKLNQRTPSASTTLQISDAFVNCSCSPWGHDCVAAGENILFVSFEVSKFVTRVQHRFCEGLNKNALYKRNINGWYLYLVEGDASEVATVVVDLVRLLGTKVCVRYFGKLLEKRTGNRPRAAW